MGEAMTVVVPKEVPAAEAEAFYRGLGVEGTAPPYDSPILRFVHGIALAKAAGFSPARAYVGDCYVVALVGAMFNVDVWVDDGDPDGLRMVA